MTDNKVILAVNNGDGKTRLLTAEAGRTVKVKLIPGNKYVLKNINDDFAPENITLQRVDKALHIIQEGDTQPSIIIEDYFNGDPTNPVLMGMAEDGLLYAYVPLSGDSYDTGYLMADGSMSPVALGGEPLGAGGPLLTAPDDDNDMLFGMLGWFALAAAGVGAAFALSEMDKDDGDNSSTPDKPSIGNAMDDEGSIKGPLKSGDVTDDSTPTLTGKGKPGDTIHIIDNGKEIGSVIVDDEGEWSYTPDKPLGEGEHELSVVEKDPDGNTSPPSDPIVIVVDTIAPKAPTIEHIMDKVGKVTGEILEDAYTDDPKPEMSGTGEAGATITIYDNGKKIGETTVNDDGRWYFKPSENLAVRKAPSAMYWFGTDELGRDILSRIIWGARTSLMAGCMSVVIAVVIGVPLGLVAGYFQKMWDGVISRVIEALLACPFLIMAIALGAFLGPSLTNAMIAIGLSAMPIFARLTRGQVIAIRNEEYIDGARAIGLPDRWIIIKYVLPNVMSPILVQATLAIASAIIAEASLSFLGLGQQPPNPSWGSMLNTAKGFLEQAPWMSIFPGVAIFLAVQGFNLLGDGLRDALDPRHD